MSKLILQLYHFLENRPKWLCTALIVLLLIFGWGISSIRFSENINDFLPQQEEEKLINEAFQHIGTTNTILVTLSHDSQPCTQKMRDELCSYAEKWVERYRSMDTTIAQNIFYKADPSNFSKISDFIVKNIPLYLTHNDYERINSILSDPKQIRHELQWDKEMLFSPSGSFLQEIIINDPLHISNTTLKQLENFQPTFNLYNGYVFSKDTTTLLISLTSKHQANETAVNKDWIKIIDEAGRFYHSRVKIKHIGASEISIGNAEQIKKDTILSSVISLVLIVGLLLLFFKDLRAILLILFSITFGAAASLFFLALLRDHISAISIGIGSIIVGIAVNYPLHYLAHLREGHSREETIREIISPLVIGNITTVGAFLSILFIQSDAMKDMGIFSAMLLVGTILFVLIFLPHIFKKRLFHREISSKLFFGKLAHLELESHTWIVLLVLLLSIPLFFLGNNVRFETDLHKINYMTERQRTLLNQLIEETESPYDKTYCVNYGKTLEEALSSYQNMYPKLLGLKRNEKVKHISNIEQLLPPLSLQEKRIEKWNQYWETNKDVLVQQLLKIGQEEGFPKEFFTPFIEKITNTQHTLPLDSFTVLRESLLMPYIYQSNDQCFVYTIIESENLDTSTISDTMKDCSTKPLVFQNQSIIQKMLINLNNSFNMVLLVCGFIVFFFLWVSFGRLELSILAFMPLTFGWIWILGIMGICDMHFNIVNIILATFIFGQGDDYTIFVTEGLMHEYTYGKKVVASYKNSVILSACIMFFGMGALVIAKHPAMKSLAEVTIVGMSSVILMAYLFPPFLYKWLTKIKGENRLMPITLKNLGCTIYSFILFLLFSLLLSIAGFFLLTIGGKSENHKLKYHQLICNTFRLLVRMIPNVEHHIENKGNYQFDKPSILVCNHQSHLDLMYTLMLNPKIICLTNKWVWHCPFYGQIIRYADYYPISNGIEGSEEILQSAIERGYSILVFPEGTRSEDCSIKRFHKGAFYLAEKFNLDIVPILIHGIGHVFPKTEFLLRKGRVDVEILPSITPEDDKRRDKTTKEVADCICTYYREEYKRLSKEVETAEYYKDLVYHNYIYKGRSIANEAKRTLNQKALADWIDQLPDEGEYHIENCGQGEKALWAALVKKELHITATDTDKGKIAIAQNCASVPSNLIYKQEK